MRVNQKSPDTPSSIRPIWTSVQSYVPIARRHCRHIGPDQQAGLLHSAKIVVVECIPPQLLKDRCNRYRIGSDSQLLKKKRPSVTDRTVNNKSIHSSVSADFRVASSRFTYFITHKSAFLVLQNSLPDGYGRFFYDKGKTRPIVKIDNTNTAIRDMMQSPPYTSTCSTFAASIQI